LVHSLREDLIFNKQENKLVQYQVLYWHDIPVQVRAREKRERLGKPLSPRFQAAIDHAAMAAGLTGDDAYTDAFQWSQPQESEGSLEEVVERVAAELEAEYKVIDWRKTVQQIMNRPGAQGSGE
jgi:predicted adenine nucleotide alpha hydrolase (AANH) superfamily ATPase